LYYSHIPSALLALGLGLIIFIKDCTSLLGRLLFAITIVFALWTVADLITWTTVNSDVLIFVWSLFGILSVALSVLAIYFSHVFLYKKDLGDKTKILLFALFLPAILLAPTVINLSGVNLEACDSSGYEGLGYTIYYTATGVLAILWTSIMFVRTYIQTKIRTGKEIVLMGVGIEFFLITFFVTSFLASYLNDTGVLTNYALEQYGFLGMAVFMVFIGVITVRFKTFNVGLFASNALVLALVVLVGAQFTFIVSSTYRVVIAITLVLVGVLGIMLVRSVKREIKHRQNLQQLSMRLEQTNLDLEVANTKLKSLDKLKTEFLSLASHQLRSPLTAIKGYASMLIEGSFGKLAVKTSEPIQRIYTSAQGLSNIVEDLLNVSKIEQGGMQYEFMPTKVADIVQALYGEMQIPAQSKQINLTLSVAHGDDFAATADPTKLKQVFLNLVDNSIKYTPEGGTVAISLSRIGKEQIVFAVKDTGMGISPETKDKLFEKFSRGEGGKVNTGGSGLGLYLAKQIAIAHKGDVSIESEGLGKGSTFKVVLPAL
jgi:signal transduction histidine kinase